MRDRMCSSDCCRVRRKSIYFRIALTSWTILAFLVGTSSGFTIGTTSRQSSQLDSNTLLHVTDMKKNGDADSGKRDIPFIIERVRDPASDQIFADISNMCIDAFFNDDDAPPAFWKQFQLGQLRALQRTDLKRRRVNNPNSNFMLVARQVLPADEAAARTSPLILDLSRVANLAPEPNTDYIRGEVIGFVEVTKRPYGLGEYDKELYNNGVRQDTEMDVIRKRWQSQRVLRQFSSSAFATERPLLTNLSVRKDVRSCGLGSELLRRCESKVLQEWDMDEIILEVESDNVNARAFYKSRGYEELFEIPTSRRYDTTGLFLREVRCKRVVLRKKLNVVASPVTVGWNALKMLRENVFSFV